MNCSRSRTESSGFSSLCWILPDPPGWPNCGRRRSRRRRRCESFPSPIRSTRSIDTSTDSQRRSPSHAQADPPACPWQSDAPGRAVGPGALSAIRGLEGRFGNLPPDEEGARRRALADWIASRANPLTWRSIVNRLWHYHFGRGIVDTPSDFGRMGSLPTTPRPPGLAGHRVPRHRSVHEAPSPPDSHQLGLPAISETNRHSRRLMPATGSCGG